MSRTSNRYGVRWGKPVLIAAGLVWIARAGIEIIFQPDYWDPKTAVDYSAVVGTSLSYFLLALGILAIYLRIGEMSAWRRWPWRIGVIAGSFGAFLAGLGNIIEDWFRIPIFGYVYVLGVIVSLLGLILAGIAALGAKEISRWIGFLLLLCAVGWSQNERGGGFLVGIALILLAFLQRDLKKE